MHVNLEIVLVMLLATVLGSSVAAISIQTSVLERAGTPVAGNWRTMIS